MVLLLPDKKETQSSQNIVHINTGIPRYTRSHFTRFRYNAI